ncbi:MAG: ubiquinol-cytochrome c reductase iron-sulfur subunit [Bacilli bacterium]
MEKEFEPTTNPSETFDASRKSHHEGRPSVSRRQFLGYALTGVGGFMAATMTTPLIRFAVDPVLKKEAATDKVAVTNLKKLTKEPQRFDFSVKVKDGWVKATEVKTAWMYLDEKNDVVALSPFCKHLGCQVNWNGDPKQKNRFYCPCHGGMYEKDGTNVPKTPPTAPLDAYEMEIKPNGDIFLGKAKPKGAK